MQHIKLININSALLFSGSAAAKVKGLVQAVTYLQLHHNIVELVVPSAANEFTDVVFTWTRTRKRRKGVKGEKEQDKMIDLYMQIKNNNTKTGN